MTFKRKVIIASLLPLVLLSIGATFLDPPNGPPNAYPGMGYMLILCLMIGVEFICLLITGIVYRNYKVDTDAAVIQANKVPEHKQRSNAFFLAAGLVLLVGGSLCFGGVAVVYG